jgi:integral membrane protein
MSLGPREADLPKIPGALRFYQVCSVVTGVLLLLLCAEMLLKYTAIDREIELGGPSGLLALVPAGSVTSVNLSTGILIIHGWFYVVYLFSDLRLFTLMRWPFHRFLLIALGGVVPFLSFIVEAWITRRVRERQKSSELVAKVQAEAVH